MADVTRQSDSATTSQPIVCPDCGTTYTGHRCPLCFRPTSTTDAAAPALPPPLPHDRGGQTFGLSTLFLFITLVAVCLGVGMAVPGLGILLALLSVPAFVRASISSARQRAFGRRLGVEDKIVEFLGSLGLVLLILVAGFAAFSAACFISCVAAESGPGRIPGDAAMLLYIAVPVILGVTVVGWLFYKTWPRRGGPQNR
jgi:hypothetical protein